ncbi:MAG TPA: methyltransferase [Burkholderiaceae bacterium]|nr:methyltransferase [Burkholderiaceae bacterium]
MSGFFSAFYGVAAYLVFLCTFLYAVAFVGNLPVPVTIDDGPAAPAGLAVLVDVLLLGVFAVQHSVMARPAFKRWWTRFVPPAIERSTYVLLASLALILLFWQWRPITTPVWNVGNPIGAAVLQALFWAGWALVLTSTFLISHFELFGLRQVYARLIGQPMPPPEFRTPFFYRHVRHPIYLGFLLAFWSTPSMTMGHLLFALATTGHILIGLHLEERDLIAQFGERYRRYRREVSMLVPLPWRRSASDRTSTGTDWKPPRPTEREMN